MQECTQLAQLQDVSAHGPTWLGPLASAPSQMLWTALTWTVHSVLQTTACIVKSYPALF